MSTGAKVGVSIAAIGSVAVLGALFYMFVYRKGGESEPLRPQGTRQSEAVYVPPPVTTIAANPSADASV